MAASSTPVDSIDDINNQLQATKIDEEDTFTILSSEEVLKAINDCLESEDGPIDYDESLFEDVTILDSSDDDSTEVVAINSKTATPIREMDAIVKGYDSDYDIVSIENPKPRTPFPAVDDPSDDISPDDSTSPSPTVSPTPRKAVTEYPNVIPNTISCHSYIVKVYARNISDYRSCSTFYGTFALPYTKGTATSPEQHQTFLNLAMQLIKKSRPFNQIADQLHIQYVRPEISFINKVGHRVTLYPNDITSRNYTSSSEPWNSYGVAYINVSLLLNAQIRPKARSATPSSSNTRRWNRSDSNSSNNSSHSKRRRRF
jgi:hypothetical protein